MRRGEELIGLLLLIGGMALTQGAEAANLALGARASASEVLDDLTPEKAIDGDFGTRWSGIPGHNEGVWYQLD